MNPAKNRSIYCVLNNKVESHSPPSFVHRAIYASQKDVDCLDSDSSHPKLGCDPHKVKSSQLKSDVSYLNIILKQLNLLRTLCGLCMTLGSTQLYLLNFDNSECTAARNSQMKWTPVIVTWSHCESRLEIIRLVASIPQTALSHWSMIRVADASKLKIHWPSWTILTLSHLLRLKLRTSNFTLAGESNPKQTKIPPE